MSAFQMTHEQIRELQQSRLNTRTISQCISENTSEMHNTPKNGLYHVQQHIRYKGRIYIYAHKYIYSLIASYLVIFDISAVIVLQKWFLKMYEYIYT